MLEVEGKVLATTEDGFLVDAAAWDERIAAALSARVSIELTEAHWEIVRFIRDYYLRFHHLPNNRQFVKAVQTQLGPEKGNSRYLHRLFPGSAVKSACLIAGLPKPPGCV